MEITSATFILGLVGPNDRLRSQTPQIAFVGRSNAGKSSLLNSLTGSKKLAITSKTPGRTRQINVFLINDSHYFMDLPGYGYAKAGGDTIVALGDLISWYLFDSEHNPRVVVLIDALVGPTKSDFGIIKELEKAGTDILVVANKVDKIKKSHYQKRLRELQALLPGHQLFPYSSQTKVGIAELRHELLGDTPPDS